MQDSDRLAEKTRRRLPSWLRVDLPGNGAYYEVRRRVGQLKLNTVCEEARCPNIAECWGGGTATFMILGKVCTRACRFCDVISGRPAQLPDPDEPDRIARAIAAMALRYVVITSVDRDDLDDGGAQHFVRTVTAIRRRTPEVTVELLTPDFQANRDAIAAVATSGALVLAQNLETVARLTRRVRDRRCGYQRTLDVLAAYRASNPSLVIKSSLMLGLGETSEEVRAALADLYRAGVDWVTLGQYLRPTHKHLPVEEYVTPQQFAEYRDVAKTTGFPLVSAGPLVRSSYRAAEADAEQLVNQRRQAATR